MDARRLAERLDWIVKENDRVWQMLRKLIVLLLLAMMTGCSATPHKQLSREEWLDVYSQDYAGVTKEQVINAAENLFRLADGNDFSIIHTEDGVYATRNWLVYMVLAAASGTDYWKLTVAPTDNGVRATVRVNTQSQSIVPMPTTSDAMTAGTTPMSGRPVEGTAVYDLFWNRMDYLLGKSPTWMTCKMAKEKIEKGEVWGTIEPLCNAFNVKDDQPA